MGKAGLSDHPRFENTIGDLNWIRDQGWERQIVDLARSGIPVLGICGGFQMLGKKIIDTDNVESPFRIHWDGPSGYHNPF